MIFMPNAYSLVSSAPKQNGDLHEKEYDDFEFYVDLMGLHHHPEYKTTPGHCQYELVRTESASQM